MGKALAVLGTMAVVAVTLAVVTTAAKRDTVTPAGALARKIMAGL